MKNFVKAMNEHGKNFEYLREKFSKIGDSQLKETIFIGPQIRKIINDYLFEHLLEETEKKNAWLTFKEVCLNFLANLTGRKLQGTFSGLVKRKPGYGV